MKPIASCGESATGLPAGDRKSAAGVGATPGGVAPDRLGCRLSASAPGSARGEPYALRAAAGGGRGAGPAGRRGKPRGFMAGCGDRRRSARCPVRAGLQGRFGQAVVGAALRRNGARLSNRRRLDLVQPIAAGWAARNTAGGMRNRIAAATGRGFSSARRRDHRQAGGRERRAHRGWRTQRDADLAIAGGGGTAHKAAGAGPCAGC